MHAAGAEMNTVESAQAGPSTQRASPFAEPHDDCVGNVPFEVIHWWAIRSRRWEKVCDSAGPGLVTSIKCTQGSIWRRVSKQPHIVHGLDLELTNTGPNEGEKVDAKPDKAETGDPHLMQYNAVPLSHSSVRTNTPSGSMSEGDATAVSETEWETARRASRTASWGTTVLTGKRQRP